MQLIPKSEDPKRTRTNIKSFLPKFLRKKNKKIKLVFLYQYKRVKICLCKKSSHFAII